MGSTANLLEQVRDLDNSAGVPFSFDCLYTVEVENPPTWIRLVRDPFTGRQVSRCFSYTEATEQAQEVLKLAYRSVLRRVLTLRFCGGGRLKLL